MRRFIEQDSFSSSLWESDSSHPSGPKGCSPNAFDPASCPAILANFNEYAKPSYVLLTPLVSLIVVSFPRKMQDLNKSQALLFAPSRVQVEHGIETCKLVQSSTPIGAAPPYTEDGHGAI